MKTTIGYYAFYSPLKSTAETLAICMITKCNNNNQKLENLLEVSGAKILPSRFQRLFFFQLESETMSNDSTVTRSDPGSRRSSSTSTSGVDSLEAEVKIEDKSRSGKITEADCCHYSNCCHPKV